jgi:hypothetical protein
MRRSLALPALLLLASAASSADPRPSAIERSADFVTRVNEAIDRGVAWLRHAQKADGQFEEQHGYPGAVTSLAYHTLRACGLPREDPAAVKAWDAMKALYRKEALQTYSAALYLMAIASHGDPIRDAKDDHDVRLAPDDMKWATEIARRLAGSQDDDGRWTYAVDVDASSGASGLAGRRRSEAYDHSNTQYALLGLKSAARCRITIDPSVWKKSLEHFLASQEPTGPAVERKWGAWRKDAAKKGRTSSASVDHARGWSYHGSEARSNFPAGVRASYASMTAGGVSSVVICRSELMVTHFMTASLDADSERSAWDGLAWLGTRWRPPVAAPVDFMRPGGAAAGWRYYQDYGVERAGVLAGVDWMADVDWYGTGAESLLAAQTQDGSWSTERACVDTCFALLFLKKGTATVRRGAVTQPGEVGDINFAEAAKLDGRDLDDFLDLVISQWRRAGDDDVRRRLYDGATTAGARIVEPLIVRLDGRDPDRRAAAFELLKRATGLDFGYDPDAAAEKREPALFRWQSWWLESAGRIEYDAASKRLVVR